MKNFYSLKNSAASFKISYFVFPFLLLLLSFSSAYSQVNLDSGLVAYYPFNGNANDESGNNNNPKFNNATLTTDYYGNPNSAYYFDGTDNYIQIPDSPSLNPANNTISLCVWVNNASFYPYTCHGNKIIQKGDFEQSTGDYSITFSDTYVEQGLNCENPTVDSAQEEYYGIGEDDTLSYVDKGVWHSLVYTYDGTNATFYIDCKPQVTPTGGFTFTNPDDLFLGRLNRDDYPFWYHGTMDEVRIYNRALDSDEVKAYSFHCADVMPLTLTDFKAVMVKQQAQLSWTTFDEVNTASNVIQRSYTGSNFSNVGSVPAKGSSSVNSYQFNDNPSYANANVYYRLKFMDKDGKSTFSKVVELPLGSNANTAIKVFPNPAKDYATITFPAATTTSTQLKVLDMTGRTINVTTVAANTLQTNINTNNLSAGIYEIVWVNGTTTQNQKLIVK